MKSKSQERERIVQYREKRSEQKIEEDKKKNRERKNKSRSQRSTDIFFFDRARVRDRYKEIKSEKEPTKNKCTMKVKKINKKN